MLDEAAIKRREDAHRAEEFLLQFLQEQRGRPVTIGEVLERANTPEGRQVTASFDIRSAIWSLVEKGRAEFTPDRKLKAKNAEMATRQTALPTEGATDDSR